MDNKDMNPRAAKEAPLTQTQPSNFLLFTGLFDVAKVDLKKEPSFYIDIKDQVKMVCSDFGKVMQVHIEQGSLGHVWVRYDSNDIRGAVKT